MERSEKDLESMCRRLVRFEESRLGMNHPDVSLKLEIRKERNEWWRGEITKKSGTGSSCCHRFRRRDGRLGMVFVEFIYWISYEYGLLDIHLSDSYDAILKPGMFEELDLKLSSLGF